MAKRRRRTPEQIITKLAEGQKLLASGLTEEEVCREFGIAESTWARWLSQYGGMKAQDAKRLKELESENARLKKIVADQALDIDMLKHLNEEKWYPGASALTVAVKPWSCLKTCSGYRNVAHARSSVSIAPRNDTNPNHRPTMMLRSVPSYGHSPRNVHGGDGVGQRTICAATAERSTTNGSGGCGEKRA